MTIVTFGPYSFDTDALRGRGFLTPYVIDGVTYELETAMRVAAALDIGAKAAAVTTQYQEAATAATSAHADAQTAAVDRQAVASDKTAVHADRLAADADAQATAADRLAVAQDKTAAAGSASAADQYASAAGGAAPAMRGNWTAVTTDADAGNGKVWANSATLTAATVIYVDNLDAGGTSVTTVVDRWGTSTNAVKGTLRIAHRTDLTKWVEYQVTGAVIDGGGYRKIPVSGGTGPGGFAANDVVAVGFSRAGDAGVTPSSFPAGTAAAPGWAVTGDSNTGLAQIGGADTLSMIAGGTEVLRASTSGALTVPGQLAVTGTSKSSYHSVTGAGSAGYTFENTSAAVDEKKSQIYTSGNKIIFQLMNDAWTTTNNWLEVTRTGAAPTGIDFKVAPTVNGVALGSSVKFPTSPKSAAYTVTSSDAGKLIVATGTWTLGLPAAASLPNGFTVPVINAGGGAITIDPNGSELVSGALTLMLAPMQSVILVTDNSAWYAIGGNGLVSSQAFSLTAKSTTASLSNNNLTVSFTSPSGWVAARAINPIPNMKAYFEFLCVSGGADAAVCVVDSAFTNFESQPTQTAAYRSSTGNKQNSSGATAYGSTWTAGSVIGVAVDNTGPGSVWFRKDGVWQGSGDPASGANPAFTGLSGTLYPAVGTSTSAVFTGRFKSADLSGSIPAGFSTQP